MAYMDFLELYARDVKTTPEFLLKQSPPSFPVSTNHRGEALIGKLEERLTVDLSGVRALDIGCAYGGYSIALAKRGAHVVGVDINNKLIDYAKANAKGDVDVEFMVADASSSRVRREFPKGSFNLIIVNDVLEHIYDTTTLMQNFNHLLDENGVVYFKVPNGLSPRFVLSEGHRKIFGLTLLDPDCWFHLHPKRASIFYRPFPYFTALFEHFELGSVTLFDDEDVLRRFNAKKLRRQIKTIFETARDFKWPNPTAAKLVRERIVKFRDDFDYDVAQFDDDYISLKYGSYFFTGFAARRPGLVKQNDSSGTIGEFPPLVFKSAAGDAADGDGDIGE